MCVCVLANVSRLSVDAVYCVVRHHNETQAVLDASHVLAVVSPRITTGP